MTNALLETLKEHGQTHLIKYWEELNSSQQAELENQLNEINWDVLPQLIKEYVFNKPLADVPHDLLPAPYFPLQPTDSSQEALYKKAVTAGKELLHQGKVAALTVAGGQGTRLGFDGPKGTYPITPIKQKTLFQYFAESIYRAAEKFGSPIPWYIMTSKLNNDATVAFFKENNYFGLNPDFVTFFIQGTMPAIGLDGKLLLNSRQSLATAPNGHGGTILALRTSGALESMKQHGVEYISYFQVDNPLVSTVDPLFLGLHHLEESEMSARMLPKTNPYEKLGNFCIANNKLEIIEYSDMPSDLAEATDDNGKLKFIAGSPAIHIISCNFVERLTENNRLNLPWHRADKKVPFIDDNAVLQSPEEPNAVKLETFIFDALPLASKTMVFEACREDEFAPTKNKTGIDSAESCRQMLIDRDAKWLEAAGIPVPKTVDSSIDCVVELSPKTFFDSADVIEAKANLTPPQQNERMYYE
jgi:UDP-N-acetylglucosamine/UDP-N-acetylgalactosamine diphosphorylase